MTVTRRSRSGSVPRYLALLGAMAMLFAVAPLAGVASAEHSPQEEIGTIVERGGDGLIPTFRFRGATRFDTAQLIAEEAFGTSEAALIARGDLYPDALAGNYLAGQLSAPILLTATSSLVEDAREALEDLGAQRVTILGGTAAVSEDVEAELAETYEVDRIGGVSRYETAAMIATAEGNTYGELDGQRTAIVASGENFPDVLVAGSVAYDQDFPILLTYPTQLASPTDAALDSLEIERVIIPGGAVAVNEEVADAIRAKGIEVTRIFGASRVETAVEFARFALNQFGWSRNEVVFARGDDFADALTVGPRQGQREQVLLLTATPNTIGGGGEVQEFLDDAGCQLRRLGFAGGFAAISHEVEDQLREIATQNAPCLISLAPQTATNLVGESHTVTATVTDNAGTPTSGTEVTFTVETTTADDAPETATAQPTPESGTVMTNENGEAPFTFTSPTPGTVEITACFERAQGDQVVEECSTATKTFVADATARLTPGAEVPAPPAGEDAGSGVAAIALRESDGALCVGLQSGGFSSPVIGAHIHEGGPDETGPVVVDLSEWAVPDGDVTGCLTAEETGAEPGTFADIAANPGDYYVNVHTELAPAGAVRGQLVATEEAGD